MLKRLWCWLVGWPCNWAQVEQYTTTREGYGIFIGAMPPRVHERNIILQCDKCGRRKKSCEVLNVNG